MGAAQSPSIQEGCSWPRGVEEWGVGVGGWTNGLVGLRRFCLFSLCRSSASLFPEPGVLGCAEVLRVGSRPPLGLGGEDQGLACKKQRHKSMSFLPFSGYLRDAQCG